MRIDYLFNVLKCWDSELGGVGVRVVAGKNRFAVIPNLRVSI